ncbi:MAG: hypothetical protein V8R75_07345 [Oscillospiraceae bacterium]
MLRQRRVSITGDIIPWKTLPQAAIVGAGIAGVRHLIKGKSDKEKMEAEQQWYTIICDMLDTVIS